MTNNKQDQINTFHKLSKAILSLFEHPEFIYIDIPNLRKTFFDNLSEILKISYDINLSVKDLESFSEKNEKLNIENLASFLIKTLDNQDTYALLNFYFYKFIQSYLAVVKKEHLDNVENLLKQTGLEENELQSITEDYNTTVKQKTTTPTINSPL